MGSPPILPSHSRLATPKEAAQERKRNSRAAGFCQRRKPRDVAAHSCEPMQAAPHEIAACSFPAWYPAFQHLTFRSEVLPLPPGFADFLVQDGVFVRSETSAVREPDPMHYLSARIGMAHAARSTSLNGSTV